jgi:hypothetical protein
MGLFKKTPEQKAVSAKKKIQKYGEKRDNLNRFDPNYDHKHKKLTNKMSLEYTKIEFAKKEMEHPTLKTTTFSPTVQLNNNKKSNELHLHLAQKPSKKKTK